jgi:hypothetical protein
MRNGWIVCALILVCSGVGFAQSKSAPDTDYLGVWSGDWVGSGDGAGAGQLEITIEKGKDAGFAGKIKATGGGSDHNAVFTSLTFDGNKMTGKYDYPLGDGGQILLEGAFDGKASKGTWALFPPGQTTDVAHGTWTLAKK